MAASAAKLLAAKEEPSSSEDEDLDKFKEAVWNTPSAKMEVGEINGKQTHRVTVSDHDHDGNELQVTPEFRAHVAKKLGQFLDGCISEIPAGTSCADLPKCDDDDDDDDDEGFRLFTTSVPGQVVTEPPPPVRRRPVPSSSESDSETERRLKEAAVSIKDLIPTPSFQNNIPSSSVTEVQHPEKVRKKEENGSTNGEGDETRVHKKKKKKKVHREESEEAIEAKTSESQANKMEEEAHFPKKKKRSEANHGENEQALTLLNTVSTCIPVEDDNQPPKVKRKKKKKQKAAHGNTVVEALT